MADKAGKKSVSLRIARTRPFHPKVVVVTGFMIRAEKDGLVDILLETKGAGTERVQFDPVIFSQNLNIISKYAVELASDPDEEAQREDILTPASSVYSNMLNFSRVGQRAETVFGLFNFSDWAAATRGNASDAEINCTDMLVAYSTPAFQKKLLLELSAQVSRKES